MIEEHEKLKQLCDPEKRIRETWYGDVYSARITDKGLPKKGDLLHIQLPLSDRKLAEAAEQLKLRKEDKDDFSDWLLERVQNHVKTLAQFKKDGIRNVVELWYANKFEDDGTTDIYILTAPYVPYADSIEGKHLVIKDVYGIAVRLGNIIRGIHAAGYVHGDISLSSICVSEDNQLVLNDFYYTTLLGSEPDPTRYKYILPAHVPEEIAVSGQVNDSTDVYALCSLLWHIASEIPADIRTPYFTTIPKGPDEFSEMLYRVMSTTDAPMELYRKQASKLLANASKNLEVYSSLSYFVPQCRERYEPIPAEGDAPEVELTEGEMLDAIAPMPESELTISQEPEQEQEQLQNQEQISEVSDDTEVTEAEPMQHIEKPIDTATVGAEAETTQPMIDESESAKAEDVKHQAEYEEIQL